MAGAEDVGLRAHLLVKSQRGVNNITAVASHTAGCRCVGSGHLTCIVAVDKGCAGIVTNHTAHILGAGARGRNVAHVVAVVEDVGVVTGHTAQVGLLCRGADVAHVETQAQRTSVGTGNAAHVGSAAYFGAVVAAADDAVVGSGNGTYVVTALNLAVHGMAVGDGTLVEACNSSHMAVFVGRHVAVGNNQVVNIACIVTEETAGVAVGGRQIAYRTVVTVKVALKGRTGGSDTACPFYELERRIVAEFEEEAFTARFNGI